MAEQKVSFPVGTIVKDISGNLLKVVEVDGMWTRMKWIREDGELSKGVLWLVPSHLVGYEEVEKED